MTHKHKITLIKCVSILTLGLSAILLGIIIFWLFYPYGPIKFTSNFKVLTPVVKQGEPMIYTFSYCKSSRLEPTVIREYVNGIVFRSSNARPNVRTGCGTIVQKEIVPLELPTGTYKFRSTVIYDVNPFRNIVYVNETSTFQVVAP